MTTDPVTRSVEIPEEAVRDAIAAFDDFEMRAMNAVEDQDVHLEDAMRAAIAAALPYLAPAEMTQERVAEELYLARWNYSQTARDAWPDIDRRNWYAMAAAMNSLFVAASAESEVVHLIADGEAVTSCCGRTPFELPRTDRLTVDPKLAGGCAPVGDGGLREALEKLAVEWGDEPSTASRQWLARDLRALLDAHPAAPAAPAVPQPASQKKLTAMLSDMLGQWDELPEATRNRRAAALVREIQPFLAPRPAERTRHAIWCAVYEAATEQGLQPSGIADRATEAVLAMSAQPVDREALTRMLAETVFHCFDDEEFGLSAKHAVAVSDAVAALLAGEQEQARG